MKCLFGNPTSENAFVTLVMKGNDYIPGAKCTARSLETKMDIVCLVTEDVTKWEELKENFTAIFLVPYIRGKSKRLQTKRQKELYGKWANISFTKWNCLGLPYKKVIFIDADQIALQSIDDLFELEAPAGTFANPWAQPYSIKGPKNVYGNPKHGSKIPVETIQEGLSHFTVTGTIVLLEPSWDLYKGYINFVKNDSSIPTGLSMFDEQSIVRFLCYGWTFIDRSYNFIPWYPKWLEGAKPKTIHYFGSEKPWRTLKVYPDVAVWNFIAGKSPDLPQECFFCNKKDHTFWSPKEKVICPCI